MDNTYENTGRGPYDLAVFGSSNRRSKLTKKSCFAKIESSQIVAYHDQKIEEEWESYKVSRSKKPFKERKIDKSIIELRYIELVRVRNDTRHCTHVPISEDCRSKVVVNELGRYNLAVANYICKWLIGR